MSALACIAVRITSIYVEKTHATYCVRNSLRDHLHIRGENSAKIVAESGKSGSPPHTWRKQSVTKLAPFIKRITSTYVEKTEFIRRNVCLNEDHLHIRGEN